MTLPRAGDVFHEGEKRVQARAGARAAAAKLGPLMVSAELEEQFAAFLHGQSFLIVASRTASGRVWASILTGRPGFASARDARHVDVHAEIDEFDPLSHALQAGPTQIGLLVIEPVTRGRIRLNGTGRRTEHGLTVELSEVFGNCPKYIQRRIPTELDADPRPGRVRLGTRLTAAQAGLIRAADTFFIASSHPDRGTDASHRGGRPGFVAVTADRGGLTFPDYQGNNMFQTLGNLTVNPAAGMLFVDWESGHTLQLTGRAEVIWDEQRLHGWPGAQRLVDVQIDEVIDRAHGSALHWKFIEAHRLNPPVPLRAP